MGPGAPNASFYLSVLSADLDFLEHEIGEPRDAFARRERLVVLQEARDAIAELRKLMPPQKNTSRQDAA